VTTLAEVALSSRGGTLEAWDCPLSGLISVEPSVATLSVLLARDCTAVILDATHEHMDLSIRAGSI
jgi:hypothetical protein